MSGAAIVVIVVLVIWAFVAFGALLLSMVMASMQNKGFASFLKSLSWIERFMFLPGIPLFVLFIGLVYVVRKLGK